MENKRIQYVIRNPRILYQGDGKIILDESNDTLIFHNCINIQFENNILRFEGFYIPKHHELIYGYIMRNEEKHVYLIRVEDILFSVNNGNIETSILTNSYLNLQTRQVNFVSDKSFKLDFYRKASVSDINQFNNHLAKDRLKYDSRLGDILVIKNKPTYGTIYYFICATGVIVSETFSDRPIDNLRLEFGNIFLKYEDALNAIRQVRQLLHEL